ncbi:carbohydrate kinase family protein [Streptomyces sp. DH37]|uniref:carbohydrate kinase family protein n=1 Tax=Streptomyces sp. DH37 TaxID=3040122 RepID=UPI0024435953|nr:PfkB family carbohydrate kinase [Streptomyces sp. DH37]MDG9701984.1 PfkB family carbohydrate kinase [Streptomyces sp. DH37]
MAPARLLALGDALADIVVPVRPGDCERLGVAPGTAVFLELDVLEEVLAELERAGGPAPVSAGGSVANTCVAFAESGGRAALVTASMDDRLALEIRSDLTGRGVDVPSRSTRRGRTGRCLTLLLPDGERAFLIWQGEPWRLRTLHEELAASLAEAGPCEGLLVEGYLLASEDGMAVARSAMRHAAAQGAVRALALSDRSLVAGQRQRFAELLASGVDAVFGNEAEVAAVTGADDAREAAAALARGGTLCVVTLGGRGAFAHGPGGRHVIAARRGPVRSAIGAGDAFAGGFLFGMLSGRPHPECLALGDARARTVLGVPQARTPLRQSIRSP